MQFKQKYYLSKFDFIFVRIYVIIKLSHHLTGPNPIAVSANGISVLRIYDDRTRKLF